MSLTPDAIPHLSPPLTASDSAADASLAEGLSALESYKKKDPAKGSSASSSVVVVVFLPPNRSSHRCFVSYLQLSCASKRSETRR